MATVWIGDFRCRQLQRYQETTSTDLNDIYLLEDAGEYSWFSTGLLEQLPLLSLEDANVLINLGFNDCAYSCVWEDAFEIEAITSKYIKTINELIDGYPNIHFYLCSVNPVDSSYPFAEYVTGTIPKDLLNDKIIYFNNKLKASNATYIDTFNYLSSTSFYTHDGVLFDEETLASMLQYILLNMASAKGTAFTPRLLAPVVDIEKSGAYWLGDSYEGVNPFDNLGQSHKKVAGDTLPNCTAYAWGRFYEILGSKPSLSTDKVELWYDYTEDGYKRGQEPALGAIMCWRGNSSANTDGKNGRGHLAVVEKINADGSIVTSESVWNNSNYWWTTNRVKGDNARWGQDSSYTFQGFIYNPAVTPGGSIGNISKEQVISKNDYLSESEMQVNAKYIWSYLGSRGWSLNAIAGMLGNMEHESAINPGRFEVGGSGFGLVQWTPKSNLTDWTSANGFADDDIDGQLERIIWEKDNYKQYYKNHYKYTFNDFAKSEDDPYTLACAFAFDYERSSVVLWGFGSIKSRDEYIRNYGKAAADKKAEENREALRQKRGNSARKWYTFLAPYAPSFGQNFSVSNLKVDKSTPTSISASFLTCLGITGYYEIYALSGSSEKLVSSKILDKELQVENSDIKLIFFEDSTLAPNKEYKVVITIASEDKSTLTDTYTFSTPQDLPNNIPNVVLKANDNLLPNNNLKLTTTPLSNSDWGYWKNNGYGYTIQLIVNGQLKKEKDVSSLPKTLKIDTYFDYNKVKVGDIVQIGIRTWVMYGSKKLYDSDYARCSNPICMLVNPVTAYINKE